MMNSLCISGVRLANLRLCEATREIAAAVERARAQGRGQISVVTPNAKMLHRCRQDADLRALLNQATYAIPDGTGVFWAAKRQGSPLCERVSGIALGQALLSIADQNGWRVFLLGGCEGVAAAARTRLSLQYPSLCICGTYHGYFNRHGAENNRLLRQIRAAAPDFLIVCFGFPLQEAWIAQNLPRLPTVRLAMGLGGSLDVWSGRQKLAPPSLSNHGLEWLWRIFHQPRRLKDLPSLLGFFWHEIVKMGK